MRSGIPFLTQNVSEAQCKDSGPALVLIILILTAAPSRHFFLPIGIGFLSVTRTAPALEYDDFEPLCSDVDGLRKPDI
jgi:hypothetical protein